MVFILVPFLIFPPDGLDSAQILSKFQLQFLRLMALPGIEDSSYLGLCSSLHVSWKRHGLLPACDYLTIDFSFGKK